MDSLVQKVAHRTPWLPPLIVACVCFLCLLPSLGNGFVNWDDEVNFLLNPHYRGLSGSHLRWMFTHTAGHYIPITWMTLGADHVLWGMDPRGYHLTSLLWHTANALLFYFLALRLLRRALPDAPKLRWGAAAAALFFAIHPLRVESVAWVTERRDVVSAFFFLLSVLFYLRMAEGPARRRWWVLSVACFALSLLSKTMGMALPFVLLLLDAYPLRRLQGWRPWIEKIPFFVLALAGAAVTAVTQGNVGAFLDEYCIADRINQPGYRICFYIWKTAAPLALWPLYPFTPGSGLLEPRFAICLVAAASATFLLWRGRRRWPAGIAAWLSFIVLIAPVIGVLQAGPHFAADRYTYLACLPFALLVGGGVLKRPWGAALAGVLLVGLGLLTVRQTRIWKDSIALWSHVIEHDPSNATAYYNRALAREAQRDFAGAAADYTEAVRYNPRHDTAYLNRGNVRLSLGDPQGAQDDYTRAIQVDSRGGAAGYFNRGNLKFQMGDKRGAVEDYTEALRVDPRHVGAYVNRGNVRQMLGDIQGAIVDFTEALRIEPTHALAYYNRGLARQADGDAAGATADFEQALRHAPPDWPLSPRVHRLLGLH